MTSAKIVADSISEVGVRLFSVEVEYPARLHAELVSNRKLSITPAGGHVRAMTSGESVRAVITATEWQGVFDRYRAVPHAVVRQGPHTHMSPSPLSSLRVLLYNIEALMKSEPALKAIGSWHLPYIDQVTIEDAVMQAFEDGPKIGLSPADLDAAATTLCRKISVIRCHHATRATGLSFAEELTAYENLMTPGSFLVSAFEHQAQPDYLQDEMGSSRWAAPFFHGNLVGWQQHIKTFVGAPENVIPSTSFSRVNKEAAA